MKWIPRKLLALGWNERQLTEEDFERCCEECGVEVVELPFPRPAPCDGFYIARSGRDVIVIDQRLRGLSRLYTSFHELCHYLRHSPDSGPFSLPGTSRKLDAKAHALAICALIPEPMLRRLLEGDAPEEDGFMYEMLSDRLRVMELYRI